jgi:hypothetical protein
MTYSLPFEVVVAHLVGKKFKDLIGTQIFIKLPAYVHHSFLS